MKLISQFMQLLTLETAMCPKIHTIKVQHGAPTLRLKCQVPRASKSSQSGEQAGTSSGTAKG